MPVTAKLSKLFYERFGDQIANELVEWFNQVDTAYRSDLREFNEVNFARFDAKLEQRLAQFDAKLEQRLAQFDAKFERRLAEFDAKFERRLAEFEARFSQRVAALDAKVDRVAAELNVALERGLKEQTRWMLAAWATLLIPVIGLWFR